MNLREDVIPTKPIDLTEWAYNSIKQLILNNTLSAGTQIRIDDMASTLNISRTPVREALLRLQNKDLVKVVPHVGCFVCGITPEEFREVFELRSIIEGYAAARAAEGMHTAEYQALVDAVEKSEQMIREGHPEDFTAMEIIIHNSLISNLRNKRIREVMDTIADNIYRARIIAATSMGNLQESMTEHRAIFEAIVNHNPEEAGKAMQTHVRRVEQRMVQLVFGD